MASRDVGIEERVPFLAPESSNTQESMNIEEKTLAPAPKTDKFVLILGIINYHWNNILQYRPRWTIKSPRHVLILALKLGSWLVPSFLQPGPSSSGELHETAYLDGLRGYASYAVFFSHVISAYCNEGWHPYGEGNNNHFVQTDHWFQRPIFRMVYNGQAAITIFFVLSGYVLSYKPYKLIHAREFQKLQGALTSTIFRRWSRLFLPVAALWVINIFLVEFNAFQWFAIYRIDNPGMPPGIIEEYLDRGDSLWGTAYNAYKDFFEFARATLWKWNGIGMLPKVDGHTWTLHVEFRSSCVLFLCLQGTSRMQPNLRLAFFMLSSATALFWDEWAIGTFLAGSAIADLDLRMRRRRGQSRSSPSEFSNGLSLGSLRGGHRSTKIMALKEWALSFVESQGDQLFWAVIFVWALLFLSFPTVGAERVAFYSLLSYWSPSAAWDLFFWLAVGGIVLVFVAGRLRILHRGLETPFSQYIGKTSFALYLVHGTVIKTLGHYVVINSWLHITGYSGWGYAMGIVLPFLLFIAPVTIVATDWFWRGVDIPTVRFGKWLESICVDQTL